MLTLNYPVLRYTPKYIIGGLSTENAFCTASQKKLNAGCFKQGIVIDSGGAKYQIISAKEREFKELNLGQSVLFCLESINYFLSGDKNVLIDFELKLLAHLNLDEVRQEVLSIFISHPRWLSKCGESQKSIRKELNQAKSLSELINMISIYP
jgi:hypothetical protein